ncbi:hypothetical protein DPMN_103536 [Dreissena polymorpha]|uniref:EF-hand domain-containing protein n=1 Tax=Dreissena polymorpha TaxID=45954 RepID=A0A9D4H652_DREPO|nr:hypothetical protein DPMN_103536 [Dreissena polymorpha]
MDENPIIVLIEFGKLMGFRLMDLFAALDKDGSKSLDHEEIRNGLRVTRLIKARSGKTWLNTCA